MNTFLLLLIGIPIVEIYLFIKMGSQIGAFNTILLIFITAFFGVIYARYEGFNTLRAGMSQIVKNELPRCFLVIIAKNMKFEMFAIRSCVRHI